MDNIENNTWFLIECKAIIQSWGSADVTVHETTAQRVLSFFILKAILVLRRGAIGSRHTLLSSLSGFQRRKSLGDVTFWVKVFCVLRWAARETSLLLAPNPFTSCFVWWQKICVRKLSDMETRTVSSWLCIMASNLGFSKFVCWDVLSERSPQVFHPWRFRFKGRRLWFENVYI